MKKTKTELLFDAWVKLLEYLDHHKIQGRILVTFIGAIGVILALRYTAQDLISITQALK